MPSGSSIPTNANNNELLGSGGFGHIYKTTHQSVSCAMKVFEPKNFAIASNSFKLMKPFTSPYLVSQWSFNNDKKKPAIIMELMEENLQSFLSKNKFNMRWGDKLRLMREATQGVVELHRNNILHRDIKTTNYMMTADAHVKLGDFDTTLKFNSASWHNLCCCCCWVIGSRAYMAPETLSRGKVSKASDVYALGLVLWSIANDGEKDFSSRASHPDFPEEISVLIKQCLWNKPSKRPKAVNILQTLEKIDPNSCVEIIKRSVRGDLIMDDPNFQASLDLRIKLNI